jgi:hypothetical protein
LDIIRKPFSKQVRHGMLDDGEQAYTAGVVGGVPWVAYHPPTIDVTRKAMSHAGTKLRENLAEAWALGHEMVRDRDQEQLAVLPNAKPASLCWKAGQCLCGPNAVVSQFHNALARYVRKTFPAKTTLRKGLKLASFVAHFKAAEDRRWFHIAWVNMNSWHMVFLRLEDDTDIGRQTVARPQHALVVPRDVPWTFSWAAFADMDLARPWEVEFWMLWGDGCAPRQEFEPWTLSARLVIPAAEFWNGPPPPPRRAPRGGLVLAIEDAPAAEPEALEDGGDEDEEEPDSDLEHDDDVAT